MKKTILYAVALVAMTACGARAESGTAPAGTAPAGKAVLTDAAMMDAAGTVKKISNPDYLLGISAIGFDPDGYINDLGWTVENGEATNITRDSKGRLASFDYVVFECDDEVPYKGNISRDADGRITSLEYNGVKYIFSEYDDNGRVGKVVYHPGWSQEPELTYTMQYDPQGRMTRVTMTYPDGTVNYTRFEYGATDGHGNWTERTEYIHQDGNDWAPQSGSRMLEYRN